MSTGAWILIVILAAIAGAIGGFFIARRTMMNYFAENPPFDEDMIRSMMTQMGQKPSEQKVRQIAASMKAQAKKRAKKTIGKFRWFFSLYRIRYNVIFLQVIHIHNLDQFPYRVHRIFESVLDRNLRFLLLLVFGLRYRLGRQFVHAFFYV